MTRKPRPWGSLVLCVSLALLGACAGGSGGVGDRSAKPVAVAVQTVVQAPGKALVTVSGRNDGAAVLLETAQELRVELQLSAWEIANNFDWSVADLKAGVLEPIGSRFERNGRDTNPTESDGATVWRLKPSAAGRVTLNFALRRPYSTGAAAKTVAFDVTVR